LTRNGTRIRLATLAGGCLRAAYRSVLAARYAGHATTKGQEGGVRSILVVRGDAIGDFVLFLPALRVLRRYYAGAKISLIVARECFDLASTFAPVDEVISFDRKRYRYDLAYRIRIIRRLRSQHFDVALNPVYSREPLTDELLYCSGARERIACEGDLSNIKARTKVRNNAFCSRIYPSSPGLLRELERNREFVEQLTKADVSREDFQPTLPLSQSHLDDACALLRSKGLDPHTDLLVGMFPGASNSVRIWPPECYAQMADFFADSYGADVLLGGSTSDRELGERIIRLCRTTPCNLIGSTTLPQLAAVLRLCCLYVGSESGPLHLAVAVGAPTLCVMGGGHFGRFYPYGDPKKHRMVFKHMDCYNCNWQCIHESVRCIREIPLERACEEARRLMEEIVLPQRPSPASPVPVEKGNFRGGRDAERVDFRSRLASRRKI
jgi:ADP-heptose:LPS heptosyltransferase